MIYFMCRLYLVVSTVLYSNSSTHADVFSCFILMSSFMLKLLFVGVSRFMIKQLYIDVFCIPVLCSNFLFVGVSCFMLKQNFVC